MGRESEGDGGLGGKGAVDGKDAAGHEGGFVAGQPKHEAGHILRAAQAAHRVALHRRVPGRFLDSAACSKVVSAMGVAIQPGATALQRMPSAPWSMAIERVRPCTAALDAL